MVWLVEGRDTLASKLLDGERTGGDQQSEKVSKGRGDVGRFAEIFGEMTCLLDNE